MTKPDLTDEDYSDLAKLVREAIGTERIRIGPRIKKCERRWRSSTLHRRSAPSHPTRCRSRAPSRACYIRS